MSRAASELYEYARALENELAANAAKGTWKETAAAELSLDVLYHAAKLDLAVRAGDRAAILEFAADVGNCAMFVADVTGSLDGALLTDDPCLSAGSAELKGRVKEWQASLADQPPPATGEFGPAA